MSVTRETVQKAIKNGDSAVKDLIERENGELFHKSGDISMDRNLKKQISEPFEITPDRLSVNDVKLTHQSSMEIFGIKAKGTYQDIVAINGLGGGYQEIEVLGMTEGTIGFNGKVFTTEYYVASI